GEALRFPGRAPAFKPDGTFTYVRHDQIVEWATRCPSRSRLFTLTGDGAIARCPKTLLTLDDLAGLLLTRPSRITRLAWLSETRLVALAGALIPGLGYAESGAVVEGRRLVGRTPRLFGENLRI